jgi:C4-dicarboxylate-specific signal transduction histidine kinase
MAHTNDSLPPLALLGLILSTVAIFIADALMPLGITAGFLYILPLWAASRLARQPGRDFAVLTGVVSVLLVGSLFLSPPGASLAIALGNTVITLAVVWIVAVLLIRDRAGAESLRRSEADVRVLLQNAEFREKQLHEQQGRLLQSQKLASIGELATGIAHELNNPLNNIGLYIGNVLDRVGDDRMKRTALYHDLTAAQEQVLRAAKIITELQTFARPSSGIRDRVSVNRLVQSSLSLVQQELRLHGIKVHLDLSPEDPRVFGDVVQLQQVLVHLFTNARDACAEVPRKVITVTTRRTDERVEMKVSDTGCGISAEVLPRLFDPFFTTKEVGKGTGLGLPMTYGIIKDHHGSIEVESTIGVGTMFAISLPPCTEPASTVR